MHHGGVDGGFGAFRDADGGQVEFHELVESACHAQQSAQIRSHGGQRGLSAGLDEQIPGHVIELVVEQDRMGGVGDHRGAGPRRRGLRDADHDIARVLPAHQRRRGARTGGGGRLEGPEPQVFPVARANARPLPGVDPGERAVHRTHGDAAAGDVEHQIQALQRLAPIVLAQRPHPQFEVGGREPDFPSGALDSAAVEGPHQERPVGGHLVELVGDRDGRLSRGLHDRDQIVVIGQRSGVITVMPVHARQLGPGHEAVLALGCQGGHEDLRDRMPMRQGAGNGAQVGGAHSGAGGRCHGSCRARGLCGRHGLASSQSVAPTGRSVCDPDPVRMGRT